MNSSTANLPRIAKIAKSIAHQDENPSLGADTLRRINHFVAQFMHDIKRLGLTAEMLSDAPESTGDRIIDTYLAALAEHLAQQYGLSVPAWSQAQHYCLEDPVFIAWGPNSRALALVETPSAFRRRNLFCGQI